MGLFENDYIMRQIKGMAAVLAKLFFGKEDTTYVPDFARNKQADELYFRLQLLLSENKLSQAEDLLFRTLDKTDTAFLAVGIDYFAKLEKLPIETLNAAGYDEDDLQKGLDDLAALYGLNPENGLFSPDRFDPVR